MASATYYCDAAAGTDTGSGTVGDPFKTIGQAMSTISGTGNTVYVKASATYSERVSTPAGATLAAPNKLIGYTTNVTDGGRATIDGTGQNEALNHAYNYWWIQNLNLTGGNFRGMLGNGDYNYMTNVHAYSNSGQGFLIDNGYTMQDCVARNNSGNGIDVDQYTVLVRCDSHSNTGYGFYIQGGSQQRCICYQCLAYDNGNTQIYSTGVVDVVECTVDGNNTEPGIWWNNSVYYGGMIINNIIHDCSTGIYIAASAQPNFAIDTNVFYSNTTNYTFNSSPLPITNSITGDPALNADYSLGTGSSAIGTGKDFTGSSTGMDIGAIQTIPSTSTGTGTSRVILTS